MTRPEVEFPVYLVDRDGWMWRAAKADDLQEIEENDADSGEYLGWDSSGRLFSVVWRDGAVGVADPDPARAVEQDALRESMLKHARLERVLDQLEKERGSGLGELSHADLWLAIEAALSRRKDPFWVLLNRLARLVGLVFVVGGLLLALAGGRGIAGELLAGTTESQAMVDAAWQFGGGAVVAGIGYLLLKAKGFREP